MTTKMTGMLMAMACAASLVAVQSTFAEDAVPADKPAVAPGEHRRGGPGQMGDRGARMKEALGLSDEQAAKVKAIFEEAQPQMKAIVEDANLSREDKQAKMKVLRDAQNAKIKALLTEEQAKKFDEMQAKRMQGGPGGRDGHGGPGGKGGKGGKGGHGDPDGGKPETPPAK